jgi:hypothetical protein
VVLRLRMFEQVRRCASTGKQGCQPRAAAYGITAPPSLLPSSCTTLVFSFASRDMIVNFTLCFDQIIRSAFGYGHTALAVSCSACQSYRCTCGTAQPVQPALCRYFLSKPTAQTLQRKPVVLSLLSTTQLLRPHLHAIQPKTAD